MFNIAVKYSVKSRRTSDDVRHVKKRVSTYLVNFLYHSVTSILVSILIIRMSRKVS